MGKIKVSITVNKEKFRKPFEYGWKREVVYRRNSSNDAEIFYIHPSGKKLHTKRDVEKNLDNGLDVDVFSFAKKPLGFDEEIIRVASVKGFRGTNLPVLADVTETMQTPTNLLVDDELLYCSPSDGSCHHAEAVDERSEKYAMMDIDELRQLILRKDDLRECLNRNELEIRKLQKQIRTKTDLSNEELQNLIKILFPMLSQNQVKIMTKQKKRVNWTCDEIAVGFALSFFSRRGYVYLIYKQL